MFDTDDFYWLPTEPPFQTKRPAPLRLRLLEDELSRHSSWVLSGSLCGWGDPIIHLFDVVLFLTLAPALRLQRLRDREAARHGAARLAPGGDLHASHEAFLAWATRYDTGGMDLRSRRLHEEWLHRLPPHIRVLRLDSKAPVDELVSFVVSRGRVTTARRSAQRSGGWPRIARNL